MKKTSKPLLCYLCGQPGADTRDHIPPRGVFPERPRGNLVTVPAHERCNNQFAQDDELLRNLIIMTCHSSQKGKMAWKEIVVASWRSNPGAKKSLEKLLTRKLHFDPISKHLDMRDAVMLSQELIERQVRRWARGLYYKRFSIPLVQSARIEISMHEADSVVRSFTEACRRENKSPKWMVVEPDVFRYFFPVSSENSEQGVIVFEFFGQWAYLASINLS